jgi:AraC-like DNA-binding protein
MTYPPKFVGRPNSMTVHPSRASDAGPELSADVARAVIDPGYVDLIMSGMRQAGVDTVSVMRRAGVEPGSTPIQGARLSQRQFAQLIAMMTRVSRDEFWMLCDRPIKPGTFRTMCRLLVRCSTLREALRTGCHFYHLVVDDFAVRFAEDDREGSLWVTDRIHDPDRRRMVNGAIIFFVYGLMCWLVGRRLPLHTVHYVFPEQPYSSELEPVYKAPLLFSQPRSELRFDSAILDMPIMHDEERLLRFLASVPSVLLVRYRDENSLAERVRSVLRRNIGKQLTLENVAGMLALSPQTLRRRLHEQDNCTFQDLKDRVRREVGMHLLEKSRLPLEEIAISLGFSELSTFHRAFRRWTGTAPGEFRQAARRTLEQARQKDAANDFVGQGHT